MDVVKDLADHITFVVGLVGAAGTIVAIIFAVLAQQGATKARMSVTHERRRQFELEILRDFLEDLDKDQSLDSAMKFLQFAQRHKHRLALLPVDDLPFWRQAIAVRAWSDLPGMVDLWDRMAAMDRARNDAVAARDAAGIGNTTASEVQLRLDQAQLTLELVTAMRANLSGDLAEAIRRRVEAADD